MGQMSPIRDLGPCVIEFGGTALGETFGATTFKSSDDTAEVREDKWGTTPVDKIMIGKSCEVEANLTRLSLAQLAAALSGSSGSGTSGDQMVIRSNVGESLRDNAKELVLKRIVNGVASTDSSEWLTIFEAAPETDLEVAFEVDKQSVFKVKFTGFPVLTDGVGKKTGWLWKIGA